MPKLAMLQAAEGGGSEIHIYEKWEKNMLRQAGVDVEYEPVRGSSSSSIKRVTFKP